jgi:hypothetical protein
MYISGTGSSWDVPKIVTEWGLVPTKINMDVETINAVLRAGGMVELSGSGPMPFTSGGHYIAIRGVTASGKWLTFNSAYRGSDPDAEFDPSLILTYANAGSTYSITKQ